MLIGSHFSIRKGLPSALIEAAAKNCTAVQIFTRSPRAWRSRKIPGKEISEFNKLRKRLGIRIVVVHIPYLPNLASSDDKLYEKSVAITAHDLEIARRLNADYFVLHPGAYSHDSTREFGRRRIIAALNRLLASKNGPTLLLENVAGGGRRIGRDFKELAALIAGVKNKNRIGILLDTAHLFGGGYDISEPRRLDETLEKFSRGVGIKYLRAIHLNDSAAAKNSGLDRHWHIGRGLIGKRGLAAVVNHPLLKNLPFILETPKNAPGDDVKNLAAARQLRRR